MDSSIWMFFWKNSEGGGGAFPVQKITLQIFLVSKRYILVVNFGKNVQKGGRGGGGSSPIQKISLQIYASYRIFTNFRKKKAQCNSQKWGGGGEVKGRLEFFRKFLRFGSRTLPVVRLSPSLVHLNSLEIAWKLSLSFLLPFHISVL